MTLYKFVRVLVAIPILAALIVLKYMTKKLKAIGRVG